MSSVKSLFTGQKDSSKDALKAQQQQLALQQQQLAEAKAQEKALKQSQQAKQNASMGRSSSNTQSLISSDALRTVFG